MIKISDDFVLDISGNRNDFCIYHLNENKEFLIPLFKEMIRQHFYKNIQSSYDYNNKRVFNRIELTPYDFYNFARVNSNNSNYFMTTHEYDAYQIYNLLLLPESEAIAKNEKWQLQNEMESRFHNIGQGGYKNKKYVLKDAHGGYLEAVYNEKGIIVLDHINDGTYNLYHQNPLHSIDIILWLMYGVLSYDRLTMNDRVSILKSNLKDIYNFKLIH